jgi:hypothetical protein
MLKLLADPIETRPFVLRSTSWSVWLSRAAPCESALCLALGVTSVSSGVNGSNLGRLTCTWCCFVLKLPRHCLSITRSIPQHNQTEFTLSLFSRNTLRFCRYKTHVQRGGGDVASGSGGNSNSEQFVDDGLIAQVRPPLIPRRRRPARPPQYVCARTDGGILAARVVSMLSTVFICVFYFFQMLRFSSRSLSPSARELLCCARVMATPITGERLSSTRSQSLSKKAGKSRCGRGNHPLANGASTL